MDRLDRALTQRMYLLDANRPGDMAWEFMIEGSRGTPYRVYMNASRSSCTCPDFTRRRQACKHIMFISLRVLRLQGSFLTLTRPMDDALKKTLLEKAESTPAQVEPDAEAKPQDDKPLEGCCPICYEDFEPKDKCERCVTCKNAIHDACIAVWLRQKPNCPLCRSPWAARASAAALKLGKRPEGDDVLEKFGHEHFAAAATAASSSANTDRMTATNAKRKFGFSETDIAHLSHLTLDNPGFSGGAPMRLYLISDLERVYREKEERKVREEASEKEAAKEAKAQAKAAAKRAKDEEKEAKRLAKEAEKASKKAAKAAEKEAAKPKKTPAAANKTLKTKEAAVAAAEPKVIESSASTSRRSGRVTKPSRHAAEASVEEETTTAKPASKRTRRA